MNYKLSLFAISQIRKVSTSRPVNQRKNHYDSLGIKKTATQADVKNAYYDLSKRYHPDRNQGHTLELREQHSQKFRDITEAYEVLGNVRTRRMYDKGFYGGMSHSSESHKTPDDPLHKFYKSREVRTRPPPPDGRQPIYDFDEWSRKHYGESVRRAQELKERRAFYANQARASKENYEQHACIYGGLLLIILCMLFKQANSSDIPVYGMQTTSYKEPVGDKLSK